MRIEYDGKTWEFAYTDLTVAECEAIEKYCAVRGLGEWSNQVGAANTRALQAYWWAVRRHNGEDPGPVARQDPAFRPVAFHSALSEAELAEAEEAADAETAGDEDPTPPSPALSSPAPSAATTTTPAPAPAALSLPG